MTTLILLLAGFPFAIGCFKVILIFGTPFCRKLLATMFIRPCFSAHALLPLARGMLLVIVIEPSDEALWCTFLCIAAVVLLPGVPDAAVAELEAPEPALPAEPDDPDFPAAIP